MATASPLESISPTCIPSPSSYEAVVASHAGSTRSPAPSEESVRVGCCACVRRWKDGSKPSGGCCFKNHKNSKWRCIRAYLRFTWVDQLILSLCGSLILGLNFAPNNRHDMPLMPIWTQYPVVGNFTIDDWDLRAPTEYLFPYRKSPLSDYMCAAIVALFPMVVIGLFQLKIRSVWDYNAGQVGVLKAVTTTTLIVMFMKLYIGAFRPNFIDVCQPNRTMLHEEVVRYKTNHTAMFFNATICTGETELVKNSLQSFPSGHAANSFAAAIFLTLYMNAKLKTIGDHASHYWAFILTITPLVLASTLSALMFITHQHHMRDIYAGMTLGLVVGTVCYRSAYAAIFDSRYNHIPLPPFAAKTRFLYLKDVKMCCTDLGDQDGEQEVDKLVVWKWWKLEPNEQTKLKEEFWLQNVRSTRATGCETAFGSGPTLPQTQDDIISMQQIQARTSRETTQVSQNSTGALGTRCARHTINPEFTAADPYANRGNAALGTGTAGV